MAPSTLYWNKLRQNFDVKRVDVIFGHNVQYTGSMSRLPILVLECSKGSYLERGPHQTRTKQWLFVGVNADEMDWNYHGPIPAPWPIISTQTHFSGPPASCTGTQQSRVRVERLLCSVKQQKESDRVTLRHVQGELWVWVQSIKSTTNFNFPAKTKLIYSEFGQHSA